MLPFPILNLTVFIKKSTLYPKSSALEHIPRKTSPKIYGCSSTQISVNKMNNDITKRDLGVHNNLNEKYGSRAAEKILKWDFAQCLQRLFLE